MDFSYSDFLSSLSGQQDGKASPQYVLFPPSHLSSPLRNESYYAALGLGTPNPFKHKGEVSEGEIIREYCRQKSLKLHSELDLTQVITILVKEFQNIRFSFPVDETETNDWGVAIKNYLLQAEACGLKHNKTSSNPSQVLGMSKKEINARGFIRDALEALVIDSGRMGQQSYNSPIKQIKDLRHTNVGHFVVTHGSRIICFELNNHAYLITRDALLLLLDLYAQRLNIKYATSIANYYELTNYPSWDLCRHIIDLGDDLILTSGNSAFDVLKNFEPLTMGALLSSTNDKYIDCNDFLNKMTLESTTAIEKWDLTDYQKTHGKDTLRKIVNILKGVSNNPHHLSQIFGLYRIWGHPEIDILGGLRKLKDLTIPIKSPNPLIIMDITCKFKELFCSSYRSKHGTWPNLDFSKLSSSSYLRNVLENNFPLEKYNPRYELRSWAMVEGAKTFDCPETMNLSTVLNDKASSLSISELVTQIKKYKNIGRPSDRRVITKWLKSDMCSAKELLDKIDQEGFEEDNKLIGGCPKERELKVHPRLFALMPLEMRMYFVVTEKLIADDILPLFPQVTMVDDLLTLMKKIIRTTSGLQNKKMGEIVELITNIDFEKWNSNMRKEIVEGIFKFLDQLYGWKNVFSRTHECFEEAIIYCADSIYIPDVDGDTIKKNALAWEGHQGGLEGLRQKGWTLVTIAVLELVASILNLVPIIMGQGDNQIIKIAFPRKLLNETDEDAIIRIKKLYNEFKNLLRKYFDEVGLPMRQSETWASSCVFAYGKGLTLNGVQLSMSLKKICRIFSFPNEGIPTLETSLSTIFANGIAATLSDFTVLVPFLICSKSACTALRIHALGSPLVPEGLLRAGSKYDYWRGSSGGKFRREAVFSHNTMLTNHLTHTQQSMLLYPSILGGFPVLMLTSFMVRGFPDPLTENLSMIQKILRNLEKGDPLIRSLISILTPRFSDEENYSQLIQDPLSINIVHSASPEMLVKNKCLKYLYNATWIRNHYMLTFLDISKNKEDQIVVELMKIRPVWPRLLGDLFGATLPGYARSLVSRINNTNTIQNFMVKQETSNISEIIKKFELFYLIGKLETIYRHQTTSWTFICSRVLADALRTRSWNLEEVSGVTVPHPLEAFAEFPLVDEPCGHCKSVSNGYILLKVNEPLEKNTHDYYFKMGPAIPYLGSPTREKIMPAGEQTLTNTEPLTSRAIQILRTIGWFVDPESRLAALLKSLLSSLTDLDPSLLVTKHESVTGCEDHRYHDMFTKHGGFIATIYNIFTYFHVSTTTLTKYAKGGKNYTVHFQSVMCQLQYLLSHKILINKELNISATHYHEVCPSCITSVTDIPLDYYSQYIYEFPSVKNNPICWISSEKLLKMTSDLPNIPSLKFSTFDSGQEAAMSAVAHICASEILKAKYSKVGIIDVSTTLDTIPFVWTLKIDPIITLKLCVGYIYTALLYTSLRTDREEGTINIKERVCRVSAELTELPSHCFHVLTPFLYFPEVRQHILNYFVGTDPPHSAPYSHRSLLACMKNIISWIATEEINSCIESLPVGFYFLSSRVSLSLLPLLIAKISLRGEPVGHIIYSLLSFLKLNMEEQAKNKMELYQNPGLSWTKIQPLFIKYEIELGLKHKISEFITGVCLGAKLCLASPEWMVKTYPSNPQWQSTGTLAPMIDIHAIRNLTQSVLNLYVLQKTPFSSLIISPEKVEIESVKPYRHYFRPLPNITTAHYKYLGLFNRIQDLFANCYHCGVLGDGTGGVTALALRVFPHIKVYYNSLISLKGVFPQSLATFYPPALENLGIGLERLIGYPSTIEMVSDITSPKFPKFVANVTNKSLEIIVCDAEGSGWDSPMKGLSLVSSITALANICNSKALLIKTFLSNPSMVAGQLGIIGRTFQHVRILGSAYSGEKSTECFILATDPGIPCPHPLDLQLIAEDVQLSNISVPTDIINILREVQKGLLAKMNPDLMDAYEVSNALLTDKLLATMKSKFIHWTMGVSPGNVVANNKKFALLSQCIRQHFSPLFLGIRDVRPRIVTGLLNEIIELRLTLSILVSQLSCMLSHNSVVAWYNRLKTHGFLVIYRTVRHSWSASLLFSDKLDTILESPFQIYRLRWPDSKTHSKTFFQILGSCVFLNLPVCNINPHINHLLINKKDNFLQGLSIFIAPAQHPSSSRVYNILFSREERNYYQKKGY